MPTNDELRAMIERLEKPTFWQRACPVDDTRLSRAPKEAALMLRSILAEREQKEKDIAAEANAWDDARSAMLEAHQRRGKL